MDQPKQCLQIVSVTIFKNISNQPQNVMNTDVMLAQAQTVW